MNTYVDPISELIHSTVRIECFDDLGNRSSGTGFIFMFVGSNGEQYPCVVTNKHVLSNARKAAFNLTLKRADGGPDLGKHESAVVEEPSRLCAIHPNPEIDLLALPIGAILNAASRRGTDYFFMVLHERLVASAALLEELSPMEEIAMIGYPNGIWDQAHNLPIIRRGITATHPRIKLNGKSEFLIDAACFPGSSGSPVFLANRGSYVQSNGALCAGSRIALLGVLYAGPQHTTTGEIIVVNIPTTTKPISVGSIPNNLGFVISASQLAVLAVAVVAQVEAHVSRNAACLCGSGRRWKTCCGALGLNRGAKA